MASLSVEMQPTECLICQENYNEPKILPCAHLLCRDCLVKWMKEKTPALCPLCRSAIVDPRDPTSRNCDDIADSLPTDHAMSAMVESLKIFRDNHVCHVHRSVIATSVCLDCRLKLCQICVEVHKNLPMMSSHKLEDLATLTLEDFTAIRQEPCSTHREETLKLFCTFHEALMCQLCDTSKHRTCPEVICLDEANEKYKQSLSDMAVDLNATLAVMNQATTRIEEHLVKSEKSVNAAFAEIDKTCDSLVNSVETRRKHLKKLVKEEGDKIKVTALEQKSSLGERRRKLISHLDLIQRVQQMARGSCLVAMVPELKNRIAKLDLDTSLLEKERQSLKIVTLTIDHYARIRVESELEKVGKIVVSPATIQAASCKQCNRTKVVWGELQKMQADVLVNSTDAYLEHEYGQVSKSLLKEAGTGMAEQCKFLYPNGIENNLVVITNSFKLKNVKAIFHTALPYQENWIAEEEEKRLDRLRQQIEACLRLASARMYKSIAFPALGTGQLGYPADKVAKTMIRTINIFFSNTPQSSLQDVFVVCLPYNKDTAKTFKAEETRNTFWHSSDDQSKKVCTEARLEIRNTLVHVVVGNVRKQKGVADVILVGDPPEEGSLKAYKDCAPSTSKVLSVKKIKLQDDMKKAFNAAKSVQINASSFSLQWYSEIMMSVLEACYFQDDSLLYVIIVVPEVKHFQKLISVYLDYTVNHKRRFFFSLLWGKENAPLPFITETEFVKDESHEKMSTVAFCRPGEDTDVAASMIFCRPGEDTDVAASMKQLPSENIGKFKSTQRSKERFEGGDKETDEALDHQVPLSTASHSDPDSDHKVPLTPHSHTDPDSDHQVPLTAASHTDPDSDHPQVKPKDFTTKSGIKVSVYNADITQLTVDVIVNAAAADLKHEGGVDAAGPRLKLEEDNYVKFNGQLQVTQVIPAYAGNLPCKKILHAVGPRWCNYWDPKCCQRDLAKTVFKSLEKVHDLTFSTVALSFTSCGAIFGVPNEICAKSYLSAVQRFEQEHGSNTSIEEIHFVDTDDEIVDVIRQTFTENWDTVVGPN